jgi:hypothetical protein
MGVLVSFAPPGLVGFCNRPAVRFEAVEKSRRLSLPHVSCAAPSALECIVILNPGLTAGPTHCRLFEAGLEVIGSLVLRPNGQ